MPRRSTLLVTFGLSAVVLACVAAGLLVYPLLPLRHARARQQWNAQRIRHYEIEASWASDWSYGHVLAEVLDNRVVGGVNLATGQPLDKVQMTRASFFVSIDELFRMIGEETRPSLSWRFELARYHPALARWLDPCAALMPQVTYDQQYAYPTSITYRGTPCFNGGNVLLRVTRFRPLP